MARRFIIDLTAATSIELPGPGRSDVPPADSGA
jgi:hypothetical protein